MDASGRHGRRSEHSVSRQRRSWPIHISQQKCWTTSLTTDAPDSCCLVLKNTFSPVSRFNPPRSCDHGKPPFRIPPPLPRVTPSLFLSNSLMLLHPRMQKRVVRPQPSPELCAWRCPLTVRSLLSPFPYSMDSHPFSDLSSSFLPPFRPQTVSI